jgi:uncharacterized paraquat-inducible protein A
MNGHTIIKAMGNGMADQISRQRRWQIQQQARGNCECCGAARDGASNSFCYDCHEKKKTYYVSDKRKAKRRVYRGDANG